MVIFVIMIEQFSLQVQAALHILSYSFIPVLLGIILHEVAHGYMALKKGDATALMLGRLTLNPVPHIDPLGLFTFIATAIASPFVFGWAKPVPVNVRNFRNVKKDMMWVALAGPMANICLAIVFTLLFKLLIMYAQYLAQSPKTLEFLANMFRVGIMANLGLAFINLMPIPPLDGSRIVMGILPNNLAYQYASIERYGFIILIVLLFTGILGKIILPLIMGSLRILTHIFGL